MVPLHLQLEAYRAKHYRLVAPVHHRLQYNHQEEDESSHQFDQVEVSHTDIFRTQAQVLFLRTRVWVNFQLQKERENGIFSRLVCRVTVNRTWDYHKFESFSALYTARPCNLTYLQLRIADIKNSMIKSLAGYRLFEDETLKQRLELSLSNFDTRCDGYVEAMHRLLRTNASYGTLKNYGYQAIQELEKESNGIAMAYFSDLLSVWLSFQVKC